jgi:predicted TIM-barrel enzyme
MSVLERSFGVQWPLIAMCHLHALPGRPRHDAAAGLDGIAELLARDVAALQDAGVSAELDDLREAKDAAPAVPVLANTGVTEDNLGRILKVADGVIVGTSLKVDRMIWNPVDPDRARRLVELAGMLR